MRPDALFRLTVEPPPEFVARLGRYFPPHGRAAWFVPAWVPGVPEDPVQRFVVYQAVPACGLRDDELAEIGWADAEVLPAGYRLTEAQVVLGTQIGLNFVALSDLPSERLRTHRYWQQHRAFLQPAWVVQGPDGGHPWRYTAAESRLLRVCGKDDRAPELGSLPYAPLDERVLARLLAVDGLRKAVQNPRLRRALQDEALNREFRRRYLDSLVSRTDETYDAMAKEMAGMDLPRYDGPVGVDFEEAEARYVETGHLSLL